VTSTNLALEPPLDWSTVDALVSKFEGIVRGFCDVDILSDAQKCADGDDEVPMLSVSASAQILILKFSGGKIQK
jgi:hypothetical protein